MWSNYAKQKPTLWSVDQSDFRIFPRDIRLIHIVIVSYIKSYKINVHSILMISTLSNETKTVFRI